MSRILKNQSNVIIIVWLVFFMAIGFYLRVDGVEAYHYSEDESFHVNMASGENLKQVLSFTGYETHPPLGSFLLHYWLPNSENVAFARGFSLLFGIALIPLYYAIGAISYGKRCGLVCAMLITFSQGCIIQSYIVRYYSLFLFCISCAFFSYLLWNKTYKHRQILTYMLWSICACLTHFSGIFFVITLTVYHVVRKSDIPIRKRIFTRNIRIWGIANAVIALIALFVYALWRESCQLAEPYFYKLPDSLLPLLSDIAVYPAQILFYTFSPHKWLLCLLLALLATQLDVPRVRPMLLLPLLALLLGIILFISGFYSYYQGRHSIWLVVFLLPMMSVIITNASKKLDSYFPVNVVLLIITLIMALGYDAKQRFSDVNEYDITPQEYHEIRTYFRQLDAKTLIVSDRDETARFINVYPYLDDSGFSRKVSSVTVPYFSTAFLLNPYHHHIRTGNQLLEMLLEAKAKGMLQGKEKLLFMMINPVASLMQCSALEKHIIILPQHTPHTLVRPEGINIPALFLEVRTEDFFTQVVAPEGSAHSCLFPKAAF